MGVPTLLVLWLLTTFSLTSPELVELSVTPDISATCGKQLSLDCSASSPQGGLIIRHMEWSQNNRSLCHLDSGGGVTRHHGHTASGFSCTYANGRLSLTFHHVRPQESGRSKPFMCKLRSNRGSLQKYSRVELQECCGTARGELTDEGPVCTFSHVYPDGDVDWLSDGSVEQETFKRVEKGGWLTITSHIRAGPGGPLQCVLKSKSGKDIPCTDVHNTGFQEDRSSSGGGSTGSLRTLLYVPVLWTVLIQHLYL